MGTEKQRHTTMCIVHKGFRGFRAVSHASFLGSNLIGLEPAIPYDTIHSPLGHIFAATHIYMTDKERIPESTYNELIDLFGIEDAEHQSII